MDLRKGDRVGFEFEDLLPGEESPGIARYGEGEFIKYLPGGMIEVCFSYTSIKIYVLPGTVKRLVGRPFGGVK